jgi:uncharacterized repeat protein (TIGR02543 family)
MATVSKWTPFGVALDITAIGSSVTRKSATQFTVKINASWETYYSGARTNYGMTASSGGGSATINTFGVKASSGSGSFTGTYSISGNGSATKSITVTFRNFNTDNGDSATKTVSFNVSVPAWTSYTVQYNANGGSGAPSVQTKWKDQTLKLSTTKPTRTGYTFQGWATSSGGNVAYASGASYTTNASITLYAVWKAISYTVKYNANGGSNAPNSQTKTYGKTLTLSNTIPVRTSVEDNGTLTEYTFKGWATSSTATSVAYKAGANYTANASITLYAVWARTISVNVYDVSYNTNGGSEVISQIKVKGNTLKLRNTIPVKHGYTFSGWGLSADSTTVAYKAGSNYTLDEDVVLYAVWTPWSHTVIFDANGGVGDVPESFSKITDVDATIADCTIAKKQHIFKGWCTQPNGSSGTTYYAGDGYTGVQDGGTVTLYAIWDITNIYLYANGECKAGEFIETDEGCGFYKDGTVHYMQFIEGNSSLKIGSEAFYAYELLERIVAYLTDESDSYLTDEFGNCLTTII